MSFAIEIKDLHKQYRGSWTPALNGLSMTVRKGQIMGLLGPNGAGKTTTISIICGLLASDAGNISIEGMDALHHRDAIRRMMGVVPQQIALFSNLSARENIRYIGSLYGIPAGKVTEKGNYLLRRLGLEKHADKRIARYSGGMKRRANIIASLLHDPALLILDEPTAGVDVQSRALIIDFLREYNASGKTILYTSHLLDEAQKLCDEVVIVDEGRYIVSGSPGALISDTPGCKSLEDVFLHFTGHSVRD